MTTNEEIDTATNAVIDLLKFWAVAFPALSLALPILELIIRWEIHKLKSGIADGSIIPDGAGGFVPAHGQSKFDPVTGLFTDEKT